MSSSTAFRSLLARENRPAVSEVINGPRRAMVTSAENFALGRIVRLCGLTPDFE